MIFVLCLIMGLANGLYYRRTGGLRRGLSRLIHPKTNMRNHYLQRPDRFHNSHFDSGEFTRTSVVNNDPSETVDFPESEDYSENLMGIREYCEENYRNTDYKNTRSEEFEKNEEYNDYYDNGNEFLDRFESLNKLKAFLCNSVINKPKESNVEFLKEKDKQNINNEKENTELDYFPKINSESNLNKLKTNNVRQKNINTSHKDYNDSTGVNSNRNPQVSIVSEAVEQSKETKDNTLTQTPHNAPSVVSNQIFNSSGNNQPLPLPLSYPTYLSNLYAPNGSPVPNIPPQVNKLNNGAPYYNQPFLTPNVTPTFYNQLAGTYVTNDNIVPIPNIPFRNSDGGITNGYTLVAIPNNGYAGTNSLGFINGALYQNPNSEQHSYVLPLNNGQNSLIPSNYVQMIDRNNKQASFVQDGSQTLMPSYDQITSTSKNIPLTQDNGKIFVSNNRKQIAPNDTDVQNLSTNVIGDINQNVLNDIFGTKQNQNEGQKPLLFRNLGASVSSSSGDNEIEQSASGENNKGDSEKLAYY
ncbi:homeobox protein 3-like isoform X2 [Vanessa cardui]|uniref:homeobox protein 3-like isoform X2 n=1 Tax=Vanessa cardui TaxID=171605 RepID=UPI001F1382C9|nr:homeobox protein 3-like isoform X2 [Vanessa cardui]